MRPNEAEAGFEARKSRYKALHTCRCMPSYARAGGEIYRLTREELMTIEDEVSGAAAAYFAAIDDHAPHAELPDT